MNKEYIINFSGRKKKVKVKDLNDYIEKKKIIEILKEIKSNNDKIFKKVKFLKKLIERYK